MYLSSIFLHILQRVSGEILLEVKNMDEMYKNIVNRKKMWYNFNKPKHRVL